MAHLPRDTPRVATGWWRGRAASGRTARLRAADQPNHGALDGGPGGIAGEVGHGAGAAELAQGGEHGAAVVEVLNHAGIDVDVRATAGVLPRCPATC